MLFFLDFFTLWSHIFYIISLYYSEPTILLSGRILVIVTSVLGSLILLGRGSDTAPHILNNQINNRNKQPLIYNLLEIGLYYMIKNELLWIVDIFWHGIPLCMVLSSRKLSVISPIGWFHVLVIMATFGLVFSVYQHFRKIDPSNTYGLKGIASSKGFVITSMFLLAIQSIAVATDPGTFLWGWISFGIPQPIAAILTVGVWYFFIYVFGKYNCLIDK